MNDVCLYYVYLHLHNYFFYYYFTQMSDTALCILMFFRNGGKNWQKTERSCQGEVTKKKTKKQQKRKKRRRKRKKRYVVSFIGHLNYLTLKIHLYSLWLFICVQKKKKEKKKPSRVRRDLQYFDGQLCHNTAAHTHTHTLYVHMKKSGEGTQIIKMIQNTYTKSRTIVIQQVFTSI